MVQVGLIGDAQLGAEAGGPSAGVSRVPCAFDASNPLPGEFAIRAVLGQRMDPVVGGYALAPWPAAPPPAAAFAASSVER